MLLGERMRVASGRQHTRRVGRGYNHRGRGCDDAQKLCKRGRVGVFGGLTSHLCHSCIYRSVWPVRTCQRQVSQVSSEAKLNPSNSDNSHPLLLLASSFAWIIPILPPLRTLNPQNSLCCRVMNRVLLLLPQIQPPKAARHMCPRFSNSHRVGSRWIPRKLRSDDPQPVIGCRPSELLTWIR